jgi:adenine deaminase
VLQHKSSQKIEFQLPYFRGMHHTITQSQHAGHIVDIRERTIQPGVIHVREGIISAIEYCDVSETSWLLPGFVDAHVHIESSMLVPTEFARFALAHGTVATVSDPHEIANVLGIRGVEYMLTNAKHSPLTIAFGAPSCVPATEFETSGGRVTLQDICDLFDHHRIGYLSEMMNWPGVLAEDATVMAKIRAAKERGLPVDGHAPGLTGPQAALYAAAGIQTDHECFTLDEANNKVQLGMKILLRQGSAARNFDALHPLFATAPSSLMLCTDDAHPDSLERGHINVIVERALQLGYDIFDVLHAACINPVEHYSLPIGTLRVGDSADFIRVQYHRQHHTINVVETWVKGSCVARNGVATVPEVVVEPINNWNCERIVEADIYQELLPGTDLRVIQAIDKQIVTGQLVERFESFALWAAEDILKIVVVNRYKPSKPAVAWIRGFGLVRGAIASSVAHDSHNIVAVGVSDESIVSAVNAVVSAQGGICVYNGDEVSILPLDVAGIMSTQPAPVVAKHYAHLDMLAKQCGSKLHAPFMTLSFMALLVIPELKLSDLGLFHGGTFSFVPYEVEPPA